MQKDRIRLLNGNRKQKTFTTQQNDKHNQRLSFIRQIARYFETIANYSSEAFHFDIIIYKSFR